MRNRIVTALVGLLAGGVALVALHHSLGEYRYEDIVHGFASIYRGSLGAAVALVIAGYIVLGGYDALASRYVGRPLSPRRSLLVAFVSYAVGNNTGFANLGTGSIRFRMYALWGYAGSEIATILAFCSLTFWIGFMTLGGVVFVFAPPPLPDSLQFLGGSARLLGSALLAVVAAYVASSLVRRQPLRVGGFSIASPGRLALGQILVSSVDWMLAASALWVLLPARDTMPLPQFVGLYLMAQAIALVSHVPAGLGVLESILVLLVASPERPAAQVLASILVYRVVYYLFPLLAALVLLAGIEAARRRHLLQRALRFAGGAAATVVPHLIALVTFFAGLVLLVSGATPSTGRRIDRLAHLLPLPVVETSHFLGSLAGAGLLILARGLQRRLDAAWHLAAALLAAGAVFSILKGLDYEEAIIMLVVLAVLLASHGRFDRQARLLSQPFSASWSIAIVLAIAASIWLGVFSYKHVEYSGDLWWAFALHGHSSRFLRASVGAIVLVLLVAVAGLMRPAPAQPHAATADDIERARPVIAASPDSGAGLALLADKALLWSDDGSAFIMYGVRDRTWIAMGDPVGPEERWPELAWAFRERSASLGARAVFYEVGAGRLDLYVDLGMALFKMGEEARVPLEDFTLEGHAFKDLRQARRRAEKEGWALEIVPVEDVPRHLPRLRAISDAWLRAKNTKEKAFSLGAFREDYVREFPVALVTEGGRTLAFANLWLGGEREELSVDLMRHEPEAGAGTMDFMLVELMIWGRAQGYRWFNLGMAPFSGLESRPRAPLWARAGAFLFRHGEHFYNFEGLRQYKEKFHPAWTPRYLACPGPLVLPGVLADVAALIGGGLKGVVSR
jgi:phosphatidylglycerol lysyltransferase